MKRINERKSSLSTYAPILAARPITNQPAVNRGIKTTPSDLIGGKDNPPCISPSHQLGEFEPDPPSLQTLCSVACRGRAVIKTWLPSPTIRKQAAELVSVWPHLLVGKEVPGWRENLVFFAWMGWLPKDALPLPCASHVVAPSPD